MIDIVMIIAASIVAIGVVVVVVVVVGVVIATIIVIIMVDVDVIIITIVCGKGGLFSRRPLKRGEDWPFHLFQGYSGESASGEQRNDKPPEFCVAGVFWRIGLWRVHQ